MPKNLSDQPPSRNLLWAMLFGNFLIGTGVLLPAGMLNQLAAHFGLTAAAAASLMMISGIVVGAGAPLVAAFTSRVDRRLLLTFSLLLYVVGHLASALIDNFLAQQIIRALTTIGAAIFTPQAAVTVGCCCRRKSDRAELHSFSLDGR
jgi:MFS transporter, DHA1 family, inner membrane transport protein